MVREGAAADCTTTEPAEALFARCTVHLVAATGLDDGSATVRAGLAQLGDEGRILCLLLAVSALILGAGGVGVGVGVAEAVVFIAPVWPPQAQCHTQPALTVYTRTATHCLHVMLGLSGLPS